MNPLKRKYDNIEQLDNSKLNNYTLRYEIKPKTYNNILQRTLDVDIYKPYNIIDSKL